VAPDGKRVEIGPKLDHAGAVSDRNEKSRVVATILLVKALSTAHQKNFSVPRLFHSN
jgi:hypothetical protein